MLPHSQIVIKTTLFLKNSGSTCVPLCTPRFRWYSPMDSHTFSTGSSSKDPSLLYCFPIALAHCNRTALRHRQEGLRMLGPLRLTRAFYCAVDYPTALSAVRLVLSDTRPSLANLYVDRINRMRSSRHVVLWDCVGERSGGRTIDTSPATACLLPRLSIVRVSAIIKRWSCLAMDSCRVGLNPGHR